MVVAAAAAAAGARANSILSGFFEARKERASERRIEMNLVRFVFGGYRVCVCCARSTKQAQVAAVAR